ncbi:MAG: hypothetical protein ABF382_14730, partial [Akkermansiaceae bacterium]
RELCAGYCIYDNLKCSGLTTIGILQKICLAPAPGSKDGTAFNNPFSPLDRLNVEAKFKKRSIVGIET